MKEFYSFLLFSFGILAVALFHFDVYFSIWVSVALLVLVSIFLLSAFWRERVGVLILFLWLVYALPFIHVVPYLWFDFGQETPLLLWGLAVNPYMLEERVIALTAMIGATGGVGFAFGVSLSTKALVRDTGPRETEYRRPIRTLSSPMWLILISAAVLLSWISAPATTLFAASYTESISALHEVNFDSAWMISYVLLAFGLCDAVLDEKPPRGLLKRKVVWVAIVFVVVFLQLLRGDRESIPFVFAALLVYFYWAPPRTRYRQVNIPWKKILIGGLLLIVVSMVIGATRHSLIGIRDVNQLIGLLATLYDSNVIGVSNLLHGTWSAALLTPLSVAGDNVYGLLPLKVGEDYVNLLLSVPPGFLADAAGYTRPIDSSTGPAWEMHYGIGGTHATVLPFMNFRLAGVLLITALWAYLLTRYEKTALRRLRVGHLAFLCTVTLAAPHWLWYGEKSGLNAVIIWALVALAYRIALSLERAAHRSSDTPSRQFTSPT